MSSFAGVKLFWCYILYREAPCACRLTHVVVWLQFATEGMPTMGWSGTPIDGIPIGRPIMGLAGQEGAEQRRSTLGAQQHRLESGVMLPNLAAAAGGGQGVADGADEFTVAARALAELERGEPRRASFSAEAIAEAIGRGTPAKLAADVQSPGHLEIGSRNRVSIRRTPDRPFMSPGHFEARSSIDGMRVRVGTPLLGLRAVTPRVSEQALPVAPVGNQPAAPVVREVGGGGAAP